MLVNDVNSITSCTASTLHISTLLILTRVPTPLTHSLTYPRTYLLLRQGDPSLAFIRRVLGATRDDPLPLEQSSLWLKQQIDSGALPRDPELLRTLLQQAWLTPTPNPNSNPNPKPNLILTLTLTPSCCTPCCSRRYYPCPEPEPEPEPKP